MKHYILPLLLCLIISISYSQTSKKTPEYRVSLKDLKMTTYERDSTANALVLYEMSDSHVDQKTYKLFTDEKHIIKLFNREAFDEATVSVYLYHSNNNVEDVKNITATTYNLNSDVVTTTILDKKNIFRETYNENYDIVKFTLPNIKEGCVITYSYTLVSPFMFKYKGWNFQGDIPKIYSEYNASIPANWNYNIKLVGEQKFSHKESKIKNNCLSGHNGSYSGCSILKYVMENIPAFIEEEYMTSRSNYLSRIEFELKTFKSFDGRVDDYSKTWKTVDKELKTNPNIGKQLGKSVDTEDLLSYDILNEKDLLLKAKAIYNYVNSTYTWNGDYKIFKDVSVKDLIKNKSGNVSAINILLHNLLEGSNIDVKPILLSTRNNGYPTTIYPVISDFNYLIVQATIEGKTYFLDATDEFLPFGEVPFRCLNIIGRLLDFENESDWVEILPEKASTIQYKVDLKIDENDNIIGNVNGKHTGYHALSRKKDYFSNKTDYIEKLENGSANVNISEHEAISNVSDADFIETYHIEYHSDEDADLIFLNPFFIKFFSENPFKLQERSYPVDFGYKKVYYYLLKLDIGENYNTIELPEKFALSLPENKGQILFNAKQTDNVINLFFKINSNETIYTPEYYTHLKAFIGKIIDAQNNTLILLKKVK